jgi:hypothetical protein
MTQEEFIKKLKREDYSYEIEGDKVVVTDEGSVYLNSLTSLPPGVVFNNEGYVNLGSLTSISPGVVFKNKGDEGDVYLDALTSIPPGVEFKNKGSVYLESLIGGWFSAWKGNIPGIKSKRLLKLMIKQGVFER